MEIGRIAGDDGFGTFLSGDNAGVVGAEDFGHVAFGIEVGGHVIG